MYPFSDLSETLVEHSALSIVDGRPWDMHRPLEGDCELQLKSFHDLDPFHVNKAFWRSCSFLLGYACESVFGENVPIKLHSFPPPNGIYQFYGYTIKEIRKSFCFLHIPWVFYVGSFKVEKI